ncbi:hypothetical protein ACYSNR_15585 [Enterococcus sp. LJL128]|uniref:hypothetical protein n=1 Tax=Enterococcus sp. LJL51 TaxID=3416656 RepID=UPI003CEA25A9
MLKLKEYKLLPVTVPEKELYHLFCEAISNFENGRVDKGNFFEILVELTDRQGYTYEILKEPLKSELDNLVCSLWNTESYVDVDILLVIILSLGLVKSFNQVKESIADRTDIDGQILLEIQEAISEAEENIANPYHDY